MSLILNQVKLDSQQLLKYGGVSPDGKIARETYIGSLPKINFKQKSFEVSQKLDIENEKRPK